MGTRVVRVEDPRLLTTGGTYTDDLREPELTGAAYVTFVRSPYAHARITGVDVSAARGVPGVVEVLTGQDTDDLPAPADGNPTAEPMLAKDAVRYVGEPVALVVTDGRYQGEDAADLVTVEYEPLPPVVDLEDALRGETLLFPESGSNVLAAAQDEGAGDDAFAACEVVVEHTIVNQRVAPVPLETRAAAAAWAHDRLTVWVSTQNAHWARDAVAGGLGIDSSTVRVITPDVGGGFGAKIGADREGVAVAWAAKKTGRPVRWVETRSENMVGMTHGRGQRHTFKIGGTRDGRITAYRLDLVQDAGAYPRMAPLLATLTQLMASGVYDIAHVETRFQVALTNTTPIAAYRGAGRPEAAAAIERAVDLFAAEIGMDPAEVRRRNFIPPDRFPFTTPGGAEYDTGEYAAALDKVLAAAGYDELRAAQARLREGGGPVQIGIGLSAYVEITGGVPEAGETARVVVNGDGTVTVFTGSSPHGQGHATAWAMLVQDELGVPMDKVTVLHGDTDTIPMGVGTFGSRSLQFGGTAVHNAALDIKEQARELAASEFEADQADLEFDAAAGLWRGGGAPDAAGNPVTSTLVDYPFITAMELPSFELVQMETPTTINPLGVKGIGEAGTIGATPAVQNAVVDAVAHLGVRHIDMPTTPERVWTAINEARAGK